MISSRSLWEGGRLDGRVGPGMVLFGRMYEDAAIERAAFRGGGRVFCIASAGCTAIELAADCEVVAVDINPVQLDYARRRFAGGDGASGMAERFMGLARGLAPVVGWSGARLRAFVDLDDPVRQIGYWREHLDTKRFRAGFGALLSLTALRAVYAAELLAALPADAGRVFRRRIERSIARHPNRENPYVRGLFLGEWTEHAMSASARSIRCVRADAAEWLEHEPAGRFDAFALSNILDGAGPAYAERLVLAVKRAAAPGAIVVLRSFSEPATCSTYNQAATDRSMLWGIVDVKPATML